MAANLDTSLYGPPVNLVSEPYSRRRTLYGYIDRSNVPELLMQFDFANPNEPNSRRGATIVPQQSLFLMNSPFAIDVVRRIVEREEVKRAVARGRTEEAVHSVYQVVFQRTPTPAELQKAVKFIQTETAQQKAVEQEQSKLLELSEKRAEELLKNQKSSAKVAAKAAVLNEGSLVKRSVLSPLETLVQALLFSNEAAYLN